MNVPSYCATLVVVLLLAVFSVAATFGGDHQNFARVPISIDNNDEPSPSPSVCYYKNPFVDQDGVQGGAQPGIRAVLSQFGTNYLIDQVYGGYQKKMPTMTLDVPDQSGSELSVDWGVNSIRVKAYLPAASGIGVRLQSNDIAVQSNNIKADATANWNARSSIWPHPSGSGTADISLTFNVGVGAGLGVSNGRPAIAVRQSSVSITSFNMEFHGSKLDFLLNILKSLFADKIKTVVENSVAAALSSQVPAVANAAFQGIPITMAIPGTDLSVNYALLSQETLGSGFVSVPLNGTFFDNISGKGYPGTAAPLPTSIASTPFSHAQAFVSEYVASSAFYSLAQAGYLNYTLNPQDIPAASPIQLNTSSWMFIVPGLYSMYPNWAMKATIEPYPGAPIASITPSGVTVNATMLLNVWVISPTNGTAYPAFSLYANASVAGMASLQTNSTGTFVSGKIAKFELRLSLHKSTVGEIYVGPLDTVLTLALQSLAVPVVNAILEHGMAIPSNVAGVQLLGASLSFQNTFLAVSANISYQLPIAVSSFASLQEAAEDAPTFVITEEDLAQQEEMCLLRPHSPNPVPVHPHANPNPKPNPTLNQNLATYSNF